MTESPRSQRATAEYVDPALELTDAERNFFANDWHETMALTRGPARSWPKGMGSRSHPSIHSRLSFNRSSISPPGRPNRTVARPPGPPPKSFKHALKTFVP
jgi:hypothetical protein